MLLKNVRCKWASIIEPNTKYDPVWEIVAVLDEEQAAELANKGYKIKTEDDGTLSYRFKRKTLGNKKGGGTFEKEAPKCVDAARNPFTELIGNGSLVNIQYEHKQGNAYGIDFCKGELSGVQVLEHVKFGDDEFEEVGETKTIQAAEETPVTEDDDVPF